MSEGSSLLEDGSRRLVDEAHLDANLFGDLASNINGEAVAGRPLTSLVLELDRSSEDQ